MHIPWIPVQWVESVIFNTTAASWQQEMSLDHPGRALHEKDDCETSFFHRAMRSPLGVALMIILGVPVIAGPMLLLQPIVLPLLHFGVLDHWRFRRFFDYFAGTWMYFIVVSEYWYSTVI